jgi:hypothetical protein
MKRRSKKKKEEVPTQDSHLEFGEIPTNDMSDIRSLEGFREWEIDQMSARDAITSDEV